MQHSQLIGAEERLAEKLNPQLTGALVRDASTHAKAARHDHDWGKSICGLSQEDGVPRAFNRTFGHVGKWRGGHLKIDLPDTGSVRLLTTI